MWGMKSYARIVKGFVFAGATMLAFSSGLCQQEVSPDHFDGNEQRIVKKEPVVPPKSKAVAAKKSSSKKVHKSRAAKRPSTTTLTAKATR